MTVGQYTSLMTIMWIIYMYEKIRKKKDLDIFYIYTYKQSKVKLS